MEATEEISEFSLTQRQSVLIPPERLKEFIPVVVGVGNVGHQVALMLAKMGAKNVILVDPDVVGPENVYPQGYPMPSLGQPKVDYCGSEMVEFEPAYIDPMSVPKDMAYLDMCDGPITFHDRFDPEKHLPEDASKAVIFCCVDSMETRGEIFRSTIIDRQCPLFIDGRVGGETMHIFAVTPDTADDYVKTLFLDSEASAAPCGARATIYTGTIAAGFMVHQFAAFLRKLKLHCRMELTLCDHDISIPEFEPDHAQDDKAQRAECEDRGVAGEGGCPD